MPFLGFWRVAGESPPADDALAGALLAAAGYNRAVHVPRAPALAPPPPDAAAGAPLAGLLGALSPDVDWARADALWADEGQRVVVIDGALGDAALDALREHARAATIFHEVPALSLSLSLPRG